METKLDLILQIDGARKSFEFVPLIDGKHLV